MKKRDVFILLLAGIAAFASCSLTGGSQENPAPGPVSELVLKASTMIIRADGQDAVQFTVLADGEPVTEDVRFYDGNNAPIELPSMTFTATAAGTYSFWAAYGTSHSGVVTVTAIDFPVPALPEDPAPESTDFARKVLLTQFTGTGCGYCPGMITLLRNVLSDEDYASRTVLAAAHTYNTSDPAYIPQRLDQAMGVSSYPMVVADMHLAFSNYNSENGLRTLIDEAYGTDAKAGISVKAELNGSTLVVRASVKAAETSEYRIGAWLLEDGIYGQQANYMQAQWTGDYDTHDNCIRIADSKVSNINFTGHSLGTVNAGETAEYPFVMTIEEGWNADNCHVVVFVTAPEGQAYIVNNAVDCEIGGEVPYMYE